jgi:hypothetical protein
MNRGAVRNGSPHTHRASENVRNIDALSAQISGNCILNCPMFSFYHRARSRKGQALTGAQVRGLDGSCARWFTDMWSGRKDGSGAVEPKDGRLRATHFRHGTALHF